MSEVDSTRLKYRQWRRFWFGHVLASGGYCLLFCPHKDEIRWAKKLILGPRPSDR